MKGPVPKQLARDNNQDILQSALRKMPIEENEGGSGDKDEVWRRQVGFTLNENMNTIDIRQETNIGTHKDY